MPMVAKLVALISLASIGALSAIGPAVADNLRDGIAVIIPAQAPPTSATKAAEPAVPEAEQTGVWSLHCKTDKMTDQRDCWIHTIAAVPGAAPLITVAPSKHGYIVLLMVGKNMLSQGQALLRVDKNPAREGSVLSSGAHFPSELVEEFKTGAAGMLRYQTYRGQLEGTFSLTGFSAALRQLDAEHRKKD